MLSMNTREIGHNHQKAKGRWTKVVTKLSIFHNIVVSYNMLRIYIHTKKTSHHTCYLYTKCSIAMELLNSNELELELDLGIAQ